MNQTTPAPAPASQTPGRPIAQRGCLQALAAAWFLAGIIALFIYLFSSANPETASASATEIYIAVQAPLSGEQAPYGQAIVNGVTLAVESASTTLRQRGFTLRVAPYDDQAHPTVAVNNAARIARDRDILAVVGHLNSAPTSAALPTYAAASLLVVNPASSNPALTRSGANNLLRILGRDDLQAAAGLGYALQELKAQRVYLISEDTPYGQGIANVFRQETQRLGLELVGEQTVSPDSFLDFTETISNTSPQLLYFAGMAEQAGPTFQQLHDAGLDTLYFMGPDSLDTPVMAELAPAIRGRLYYTRLAAPAAAYEAAADFVAAYEARFNRPPDEFALQAYEATLVVLAALEQSVHSSAARPLRADVLAAARNLNRVAGILQPYAFSNRGDPWRASYLVYQFNEDAAAEWAANAPVAVIWHELAGR